MEEKIKFKKSVIKSVIGYLQGELNYFLQEKYSQRLDKSIKQIENKESYKYNTAKEMIEDAKNGI